VTDDEYVYAHGKRIRVGTLNTSSAKPPRKRFRAIWLKFPMAWIEALQDATGAAWTLAAFILHEDFKRKHVGGDIVLSAATGLPRNTRRRAIKELVRLGLVQVDQSGHGAPRVTKIGGPKMVR